MSPPDESFAPPDNLWKRIGRHLETGSHNSFAGIDFPAACVAAAAAILGLAVLTAVPADSARLEWLFPEHRVGTVDSFPQRTAYFVFLAALAAGTLTLPFFARKLDAARPDDVTIGKIIGIAVMVAILAASIRIREGVVAAPLLFAAAIVADRSPRWTALIGVMTAAVVIIAVVPGLLGTPIFDLREVATLDIHYAAMLGHGERLAAGQQLFVDIFPFYGILTAVVSGLFSKLASAPSLADLTRVVQAAQIAALGAFMGAAWLRTRGASRGGRMLALFFVALATSPWLGTLSSTILAPTQSGLRFLMVPVGVIVAVLMKDIPPKIAGLAVGTTSALSLLYNLETGIAVSAGLAVAWLVQMRLHPLAVGLQSLLLGLLGVAAAVLMFAALYRLQFGAWPLPQSSDAIIGAIKIVAGGYVGSRVRFRPLALVILLCAAYVLVRTIRATFDRRVEAPDPAAASIATTTLVFLPYYINRPLDENLWVFSALLALLLAPMIADSHRRLVPAAIAAFLIVPPAFNQFRLMLVEPLRAENLTIGWRHGCADGLLVREPETHCKMLADRASALRRHAEQGTTIWSSQIGFLMGRMSQQISRLPESELFIMSMSPTHLSAVVQRIRTIDPRFILTDIPAAALFPARGGPVFAGRVLDALGADYCVTGTDSGWQVIERSPQCAQK